MSKESPPGPMTTTSREARLTTEKATKPRSKSKAKRSIATKSKRSKSATKKKSKPKRSNVLRVMHDTAKNTISNVR